MGKEDGLGVEKILEKVSLSEEDIDDLIEVTKNCGALKETEELAEKIHAKSFKIYNKTS